MMTTMAAMLGALPIALGIGAGADARRPLGLTVVGGLLLSRAQRVLADHPVSRISFRRRLRGAALAPRPAARS